MAKTNSTRVMNARSNKYPTASAAEIVEAFGHFMAEKQQGTIVIKELPTSTYVDSANGTSIMNLRPSAIAIEGSTNGIWQPKNAIHEARYSISHDAWKHAKALWNKEVTNDVKVAVRTAPVSKNAKSSKVADEEVSAFRAIATCDGATWEVNDDFISLTVKGEDVLNDAIALGFKEVYGNDVVHVFVTNETARFESIRTAFVADQIANAPAIAAAEEAAKVKAENEALRADVAALKDGNAALLDAVSKLTAQVAALTATAAPRRTNGRKKAESKKDDAASNVDAREAAFSK